MTTEQMRTFLAVADCLNFTKAAERLYLSQPTISRQIQSLEEECKTPLLVRTRKEVRLTPAGAIMVSHLKNSLEEIEAGLEEMFSGSHVKSVDNAYRKEAGKPIDNVLVGRK